MLIIAGVRRLTRCFGCGDDAKGHPGVLFGPPIRRLVLCHDCVASLSTAMDQVFAEMATEPPQQDASEAHFDALFKQAAETLKAGPKPPTAA